MKAQAWSCPACGQPFNSRSNKSEKRKCLIFVCLGASVIPHVLKIYRDGFRDDAPFLIVANDTPGRKTRAGALLERVKALSGGQTNAEG